VKFGYSVLSLNPNNAHRKRYGVASLYQAERNSRADGQIDMLQLAIQLREARLLLKRTAQLSLNPGNYGFALRLQLRLAVSGCWCG